MFVRSSSRVTSKHGRFTLAVTLGFALTAIGVSSVAFDPRSGNAEGFLDELFGGGSLLGQQSPFAMAGYGDATPVRPAARRHAVEHVRALHYVAHVPRHREHEDDPLSASHVVVSTNAQSVCVRTCDGFAFPVGTYHGASDLAAHEATCHAECPGAATSLFVLPPNASSVDAAVSVRTGETYSKLPDAFHYTTLISEACRCHPAEGGTIKSLLRDFTLRRGDAVMTARGVKVFHGGPHYPFRRQDFIALNHSQDVSKEARSTFKAIERASLTSDVPAFVSKAPAPEAVSRAPSNGTKQLEHQASR